MRTSIASLLFALAALSIASPSAADPVLATLGAACLDSSVCASGFCVDGHCCDQACGGQCQACDVATSLGTCTAITGAPHGTTRSPCTDGGTDFCAAMACDGFVVGACAAFANVGAECSAGACTSLDVAQRAGICDDHGACVKPPVAVCDPFACDEGTFTCATTCDASSSCASGFWCANGACIPLDRQQCTPDLSASLDSSGTSQQCSPFLCSVSSGACATSCTVGVSGQCASGFECGSTGVCAVPPPPSTQATSSFGCAIVGAGVSARGWGAAISGYALLFAVARRRRLGRAAPTTPR